MNAGSLFSGIGGMDEGLRRAGIRHVFFAESDAYRRDVLRARFPGATVYDDVRDVASQGARDGARGPAELAGGAQRERVASQPLGLLAGGFPCQDLSVAGQRAGLAGDRSGLFFEFARVADALRPRWLLVENVPGLLSSNGGRDFGVVLGTLADLGYGLGWRVLDSRFFGVPQRRRRVFIVGALADGDPAAASERAGQVLAVGARCGGHPATRGEAGPDTAGALGGVSPGGVWRVGADEAAVNHILSYALNGKHGNRDDGESETFVAAVEGGQPPAVALHVTQDPIHHHHHHHHALGHHGAGVMQGASVRRLTPTECERLQGLPDGWTQIGGTPDSKRYAALGDAVTANVAFWIGGRLVAADTYYTGAATGGALPDPGSAGARVGNET